jgi:hypothetical protein
VYLFLACDSPANAAKRFFSVWLPLKFMIYNSYSIGLGIKNKSILCGLPIMLYAFMLAGLLFLCRMMKRH